MVACRSPKPFVGVRVPLPVQIKIRMANITAYVKDVVDELVNKVTWPTRRELQESALLVLVASFLFALLIYLMDGGFASIMDLVYGK